MIAWLAGIVGPRFAKPVAIIGGLLLIGLAFWLVVDAYGDSRYNEGKQDEAQAWQEASDRLKERAAATATKADDAAAKRAEEFNAKVEAEKEKINEAVAEGRSPFDALFPADSR